MQCSACRVVYSNGLELCPRCKTPASVEPAQRAVEELASPGAPQSTKSLPAATEQTRATAEAKISSPTLDADASSGAKENTKKQAASTLIEFPGAGRASRPQWRKDLSERVREIQERRAREAIREIEQPFIETPPTQNPLTVDSSPDMPERTASTLGLVPTTTDAAPVNPLVAAALRRIERAHQSTHTQTRARSSSMNSAAATAVARVTEERYQPETALQVSSRVQLPETQPLTNAASEATATNVAETNARPSHNLIVVPAHSTMPERTEPKAQPRLISKDVVDDALLARLDAQQIEPVQAAAIDAEKAPVASRVAGGLTDLLIVVFASTPFAAIIELTNGNWTDSRVALSMGGIFALVMFLYLTASTALAGRTWGMSSVSLRAVDVQTGLAPSTKQSISRAFVYMLSLAACGLGLLYALMDAEGRAVHDHLSGTIVVRD